MIRATTWMNREHIMLTERSQTHKVSCASIYVQCPNGQTHRDRLQTAGCQGWGQRDTERLLGRFPLEGMEMLGNLTWGIIAHAINVLRVYTYHVAGGTACLVHGTPCTS